jgi:hypothetical protein
MIKEARFSLKKELMQNKMLPIYTHNKKIDRMKVLKHTHMPYKRG